MTENIGLFSGGRDSLVACHYLWEQGKLNEVLYCRTGVGLNEDYVKEISENFGWKLNIIHPVKNEFEMFCERYGFPRPTSHFWIMNRLKWNPLEKWHAKQKKKRDIVLVSGIRLQESKRRRMNFKGDTLLTESRGMKFLKPLLHWSGLKVLDYIKSKKLRISPIYKTVGIGGDCFCGAYSKKQHSKLLMEHHPKLANRILELEKTCRGSWGQWMGLTDCQGQRSLDSLICNECQTSE